MKRPASYYREWRRKNPAKARALTQAWKAANKDRHMKARYGLTQAQFDAMKSAQDGRCALCEERPRMTLCVDHDHATLALRDLLCRRCNRGLGFFNDSPALLRKAIMYLAKHARHDAAG